MNTPKVVSSLRFTGSRLKGTTATSSSHLCLAADASTLFNPKFLFGNIGTFKVTLSEVRAGWHAILSYEFAPNWNVISKAEVSFDIWADATSQTTVYNTGEFSSGKKTGTIDAEYHTGNIFNSVFGVVLYAKVWPKYTDRLGKCPPSHINFINSVHGWWWSSSCYGNSLSFDTSSKLRWLEPEIPRGDYTQNSLFFKLQKYVPSATSRLLWSVLPPGIAMRPNPLPSDSYQVSYFKGYYDSYSRIAGDYSSYGTGNGNVNDGSGYFLEAIHNGKSSGDQTSSGKIILKTKKGNLTVNSGSSSFINIPVGIHFL